MSTYPVNMDSKFSLPEDTQDYMKKLEKGIRDLESQLHETEKERSNKAKTVLFLFAKLKAKDVEIETMRAKVELRTSQIRQLMEKFKDVISDYNIMQSQNKHLTSENATLVSLCDAKKTEIELLRAQLAQ